MATSSSPKNIAASRTLQVAVKAASESPSGSADAIFALEFDGNTPKYQSASDPHPGGGYGVFAANLTEGIGINGTNITAVDITDDPLFPSGVKGLRDTYLANGALYNFVNQTYFLYHPERQRFYMRMRIRWSSNWQWGDDQLKFCKNTTDSSPEVSTNCPKFDGDGTAYITKLVPANPGLNDQSVYAVNEKATTDYKISDDIVNDFGGSGIDANWTPVLGQWYWLEWEIDAGTPGQADGFEKIWIDGQLYISIENVQVAETGDNLFSKHELGHVWQGSVPPTEDIYMDWHSIEIWPEKLSAGPLNASIFSDSFESGDLTKTQNGFVWTADTWTYVNTNQPKTGAYSLEFLYNASAPGQNSNLSEQRFDLGAQYTELWMQFDLYVPSNFYHRDDDVNNPGNSQFSNNKFLRLWPDAYNSKTKVGFSYFWKNDNQTGESAVNAEFSRDGGAIGTYGGNPLGDNFLLLSDRGTWITIKIHAKQAQTAAERTTLQMWKNGTLVVDRTDLDNYVEGELHSWRYGYLMGAANSGWDEETRFYIDNFVVSETEEGLA